MTIDDVIRQVKEFEKLYQEDKHKALVECIENYDFMVGSAELKGQLEQALPEGANVVYSRFIEDPTVVYVVKKFDLAEYFDLAGYFFERW